MFGRADAWGLAFRNCVACVQSCVAAALCCFHYVVRVWVLPLLALALCFNLPNPTCFGNIVSTYGPCSLVGL